MKNFNFFLFNYVKSMRLYYAFVTGISGWLGIAFYQFLNQSCVSVMRTTAILAILFLSWGINQIINDYLGLKEDRINAPNRPMVSGALPVIPALTLTFALLSCAGIAAWLLNPWAVIPMISGVLLNVIYEYSKAYSLLANLVFGVMLVMCPLFGFLAAGNVPEVLITSNRLSVLCMVAAMNASMTFYTYFKDYEGDKKAGKRTFVVKYGINRARYAGIAMAFIPILLISFFIVSGLLPWGDIIYKKDFIFCASVTLFLNLWTAVVYFRRPSGFDTYFNLKTNFRSCVIGQCMLMSIFNGRLALYLLVSSYILIGLLFDFHKDARS